MLKERTARDALGKLLHHGYLGSDSPKGVLRAAFPTHALGSFFPNLYRRAVWMRSFRRMPQDPRAWGNPLRASAPGRFVRKGEIMAFAVRVAGPKGEVGYVLAFQPKSFRIHRCMYDAAQTSAIDGWPNATHGG